MLRKLLKHEFRATGRIMLPLFGLLLILSFFMGIGVRVFDGLESTLLQVLFVLFFIAYGVVMAGIFIAVLVLMVSRFRNNYLRDEGYVMFTLPVDVHRLVWGKALVASAWFLVAVVAACLSGLIVGLIAMIGTSDWLEFWRELMRALEYLNAYYAINGITILLEGILVTFVGYVSLCLMCYASLAIGHGFDRRKMLLSVVFFVLFYTALQIIGAMAFVTVDLDAYFHALSMTDAMAATHLLMFVSLAAEVVTGAVFYFITTHSLKTRLNLE